MAASARHGTRPARGQRRRHEHDQADGGAGDGALHRGADDRGGRTLHRGRLGDLRAWQRRGAGRGAARRARRSAHLARPQRADHGAHRHRLCQAARPEAGDGGDLLHRTRRHEHGHRRRARSRQPAAGAPDPGRCLRQSRPRPGAPAGRGFHRRHGQRQRLLPPGEPLFRPDHAARAASHRAPTRIPPDDRPGRLRAGDARLLPGRAGGGLRLARELLRPEGLAPAPPSARSGGARGGGRDDRRGAGAGDRRRRRGALFPRDRRAPRLRRGAWGPRGRDAGGQIRAALGPSAEPRPGGRHRQHLGQCRLRGGRRDPRRGHPVPGLHHRLLGALPQPAPQARQPQRQCL